MGAAGGCGDLISDHPGGRASARMVNRPVRLPTEGCTGRWWPWGLASQRWGATWKCVHRPNRTKPRPHISTSPDDLDPKSKS